MIPDFNDDGYLPPGIHPATLDEVAARFGQGTETRQVQMESLRWLVGAAKAAGIVRIIVNGSFVTDLLEPNDVDCVLLFGPDYPADAAAEAQLAWGFPFVHLELVQQKDFDYFAQVIFATDRQANVKGMIEVKYGDSE